MAHASAVAQICFWLLRSRLWYRFRLVFSGYKPRVLLLHLMLGRLSTWADKGVLGGLPKLSIEAYLRTLAPRSMTDIPTQPRAKKHNNDPRGSNYPRLRVGEPKSSKEYMNP